MFFPSMDEIRDMHFFDFFAIVASGEYVLQKRPNQVERLGFEWIGSLGQRIRRTHAEWLLCLMLFSALI